MIESIQYISQHINDLSHVENIYLACKSGVKWVQLRDKESSDEDYLQQALQAKLICVRYGAKLILNDRVHLVASSAADGVHVGLNDMPVEAARQMLGSNYIIGATANTLEDCLKHSKSGANYIGLGPLRQTETKQNLSPVLGLAGYQNILNQLASHGIITPVVAVGGVVESDLAALLDVGIQGIAIASLISNSANKPELIKRLEEIMNLNKSGVLC